MNSPESPDNAMDIVTLGERGQIVIPSALRDRLGLKPGDKLMVFTKHSEVICAVPASSMKRLVNVLSNQISELERGDTPPATTSEPNNQE